MSTINEMFPPGADVKGRLAKAGIRVPDSFRFSSINIVIGKNGAGKTRFLRALKALYGAEGGTGVELLYGYFPGLSDRWIQGEIELPEHELREFPNQPEVRFDDFFKEIETQSEGFLKRLQEYHSKSQKEMNEKILENINDFFYPLTGKKLAIFHETIPTDAVPGGAEGNGLKLEGLWILETGKRMTGLSAVERFSPGERLLLYMAVFFALRRNSDRERVIILDEPETHLHPQALLAFVRALDKHFPRTTVWIATHSLFLLPEFRFEDIVYMEDGAVVPRNSDLYETVLTALLGEDHEGTRRFFTSLPYWQYVEFITECFAYPEVVDAVNPKDEQVQLFIKALDEGQIHRVLDCGGGSGRLGLSLEAAGIPLDGYEIYDREPSYQGDKFPVYTRLEDIRGPYDCVVMMNFLHEAEPAEWPELFHELYQLLKPDGSLLFVEVAALRDGEWPNKTGYMVLGRDELAALFNYKGGLPEIRIRDKQKSLGMLVPRQLLEKVTMKTVSAAIQRLEDRTFDELTQIRAEAAWRKKDGTEQPINGRRYAFLSQQYINARLFNDTTHMNLSQRLYELVDKDEKLLLLFRYAKKRIIHDFAVHPGLSGNTRSMFKSTIDFYRKNGRMTDAQRRGCTMLIRQIENSGASKQTVDAFLALLAMMGEEKAMLRLDCGGLSPMIRHLALDPVDANDFKALAAT